MIVFEDILGMLAEHGWSQKRLLAEKKISNGTIISLRAKRGITTKTIDTICELCDCQPNDFMKHVKEEQGN